MHPPSASRCRATGVATDPVGSVAVQGVQAAVAGAVCAAVLGKVQVITCNGGRFEV